MTGAADDDPSGIATYSIAGAQLGNSLLWTALLTWPLMAAVQMTCARIGMVRGEGLAASLRKRIPRSLVIAATFALLVANTINIAADLSGMADAAEMLTGLNSHVYVVVFGAGIGIAMVRLKYDRIASTLRWLALALFAYVVTAFQIHVDWSDVARNLIPSWPKTGEAWAMLVAILGTTISPYLFYWQVSQEIEEQKAAGKRTLASRKGAREDEIRDRRLDVGVGTFFSNLVMFFIILTAAATLHAHGVTKIETSRQAAEALRPLAGSFAATLFTVGVLGVGFLAIPTLAGSAAYAFAETFGWKQGLDKRLGGASGFYCVIALATAGGIALDFANVSPMKALYWSAIVNGLLAPFLLVGVLLVASSRALMEKQPSPVPMRIAVGLATLLMFGAAVGMFVF